MFGQTIFSKAEQRTLKNIELKPKGEISFRKLASHLRQFSWSFILGFYSFFVLVTFIGDLEPFRQVQTKSLGAICENVEGDLTRNQERKI